MNEIIEKLSESLVNTLRGFANSKNLNEATAKAIMYSVLLAYGKENNDFGCAVVNYAFHQVNDELYEMLKESNN